MPSEKAFAYKMKMEAMSHQGKATLSQVATKSDTATEIGLSAGESRDQVFRYIRLTELIPELLQMVDEKKIAFNPAVELSYLPKEEQRPLYEAMLQEERTPSLSQAQRIKKLSQEQVLNEGKMLTILAEDKPNQKEQVKVPMERISKYLPRNATAKEAQAFVEKAIIHYTRALERRKEDRER